MRSSNLLPKPPSVKKEGFSGWNRYRKVSLLFTCTLIILAFSNRGEASTLEQEVIKPSIKKYIVAPHRIDFGIMCYDGTHTFILASQFPILSLERGVIVLRNISSYTRPSNSPDNPYLHWAFIWYNYGIAIPDQWDQIYLAAVSYNENISEFSEFVLINNEISPDYETIVDTNSSSSSSSSVIYPPSQLSATTTTETTSSRPYNPKDPLDILPIVGILGLLIGLTLVAGYYWKVK